ncbi:hypothetical protein TNCV_4511091 [Trichonephila clavipes]|nr:hypothetical protein TNCV_4511091 [Trichonephila clavipes]
MRSGDHGGKAVGKDQLLTRTRLSMPVLTIAGLSLHCKEERLAVMFSRILPSRLKSTLRHKSTSLFLEMAELCGSIASQEMHSQVTSVFCNDYPIVARTTSSFYYE